MLMVDGPDLLDLLLLSFIRLGMAFLILKCSISISTRLLSWESLLSTLNMNFSMEIFYSSRPMSSSFPS